MRDLLLSKWAQVRGGLLATIEKLSDAELAYKPFAKGYSVAETLLHIAHEEDIELRYGLARGLMEFPPAYDAERFRDKGAIVAELGAVHEYSLRYLHGLSDGDLRENVETPWGASLVRSEVLFHVIEHEIHHRGELSLMLGLLGREGLDA